MSFFDMAKSAAAGYLGAQGGSGNLVAIVMALMEKNGGLGGVIEKFNGAGLGGVVQSWLGSGANLPISPEQISKVFGHPQVQSLAQQFGLNPEEIAKALAGFLPGFVDKLSPQGEVPRQGFDAAQLLEIGKSIIGR
jgi:uncharacterized protein YidB (DUF937 family)